MPLGDLLSNAVKFTPAGGWVSIRLRRAGASARIEVADSGQGITPQFLPHVFERFRQADATTQRLQGGLGLGLAISRQLVEMHGGLLRAESPGEGMGAVFTMELPLASVLGAVTDERGRALDGGFAAHVSKPVEPDQLVAVVERLASGRA